MCMSDSGLYIIWNRCISIAELEISRTSHLAFEVLEHSQLRNSIVVDGRGVFELHSALEFSRYCSEQCRATASRTPENQEHLTTLQKYVHIPDNALLGRSRTRKECSSYQQKHRCNSDVLLIFIRRPGSTHGNVFEQNACVQQPPVRGIESSHHLSCPCAGIEGRACRIEDVGVYTHSSGRQIIWRSGVSLIRSLGYVGCNLAKSIFLDSR